MHKGMLTNPGKVKLINEFEGPLKLLSTLHILLLTGSLKPSKF